jgi:ADP-ribose pyrophosphatase YjhB (NUDIX family)
MTIFDVFQKGLTRGSAHLPFDPKKAYAYVEHPVEGWRVYLRTASFLHPLGVPFDPKQFLVVKKTGTRPCSRNWEPPKGQMEGKDIRGNPRSSVLELLAENARREVEEESHVSEITRLRHTGLVFQSQESSYPSHWYFQYHIFEGFLAPAQIEKSFGQFAWFKAHPKAFARVSRDRAEKDAAAWFSPSKTLLNPRWCPSILVLYLNNFK